MQHPLIAKENSALRSRVLKLIKEGYLFPGRSNIVFVCGGNAETDMRSKFVRFCEEGPAKYLLFLPEYAIEYALSIDDEPFNLSDFETLIGHLSVAIVLFPEGAGSFAEAGYFSAIDELAKKTILILDEKRLGEDSFLSLGPAKLIGDKTRFHPAIHMDYDEPSFQIILDRIGQRSGATRRKSFPQGTFSKVGFFEKFSIVGSVFDLLEDASIEDVIFIVKGLFAGRSDRRQIEQIASIFLGANLIESIDSAGRFSSKIDGKLGFTLRDGYNEARNAIRIEIRNLLIDRDSKQDEGGADVA